MKIDVYNGKSKVNDIEISNLFGDISDEALFQAFIARLSHNREGNAHTLTKSEVAGGGKKPWKQKGLGRARAGSIRSPLWKGGGVIFGPKPRDFHLGVNKKQKARAYQSAFSKIYESGKLKVVKNFSVESGKTRDFIKEMGNYVDNINERVVIITGDYDKKSYLASRNIPKVTFFDVSNIDLLPIVYADTVIISEKALVDLDKKFEKTTH